MQLTPREYFTVARGLEDHTDGATYYVRAVIRDARTDVLIDTINLTNQGDGHRFSLPWQVPADPSGQGFYVLVTTSVYTDSGYTTKSELYGDKYDTYLVHRRPTASFGSGGGGPDVDYKKVRKIVEEVVGQALKTIPVPEKPEIPAPDLSSILEAVRDVGTTVRAITIPEQKETDLQPVLNALFSLKETLQDKAFLKDHLQELSEIKEALLNAFDEKMSWVGDKGEEMNKLLAGIREFFAGDVDKILENTDKIEQFLKKIDFIAIKKGGESEEKEV